MGLITTPDVMLNAATAQAAASGVGPTTLSTSISTPTVLVALAITTTGQPVQIAFDALFTSSWMGGTAEVGVEVYQDTGVFPLFGWQNNLILPASPGAGVGPGVNVSGNYTTTPAPGVPTFYFIAYRIDSNAGNTYAANYDLSLTEIKR